MHFVNLASVLLLLAHNRERALELLILDPPNMFLRRFSKYEISEVIYFRFPSILSLSYLLILVTVLHFSWLLEYVPMCCCYCCCNSSAVTIKCEWMHEWFLAKQKITNKAAANKCKIYCCRYLVCYCCNKPIALLLICFSCYYCSCCFCSCCCCCCNYVGIGTFGSYPQFFILFDYFACIFRPCLFFLRFTLCRLLLIVVIVTLDSSELVS